MDPLVSTDWLADHLGDPDVQVVDATWYMTAADGDGARDYAAGHIPGAVHFAIDEIADHASALPHMLPSPAAFAQAAGQLGLRREATVVVYSGAGIFSAPRVWWSLRAMGFDKVLVLDGGVLKWRAEGRPVETTAATPQPTSLAPRHHPELVRSLSDMRGLLANDRVQIVDARPAARFSAEAPEPRAGLRSGHMPGARSVPSSSLMRPDGTFKSAEELAEVFALAGVDTKRPIVTTCGSGVTAATLSMALARLGAPDAPVYDGSWTEWGGRSDTPVAISA
jgi:thiosulfate/3-mercaptopyruvate sulfurtransferase